MVWQEYHTDKEGHLIGIKWSIQKKQITILNLCSSYNIASKYILKLSETIAILFFEETG